MTENPFEKNLFDMHCDLCVNIIYNVNTTQTL